ncbi:PREDICTED: altered inheritance rate of mitochondria protein 25 isoform X2 [Nelumbo nucifera]|uniref:Phospholipid scramblase n=2 Tax=Nelumbo nucifera TaxID=4432 RepID=A0A1U8A209_NELNU|nr:PREDICTED: altered inheritance rate of mitochondria protein 25 isoform X2 [Nelumbo nucifera]DAD19305.1 TPA_asm: hypothetical protein HUJ06_020768 [Nelumbo nucifera]
MRWIKDLYCISKYCKSAGKISELDASMHHAANKCKHGISNAKMIVDNICLQPRRGYCSQTLLQQIILGTEAASLHGRLVMGNNALGRFQQSFSCKGSLISAKHTPLTISRWFGSTVQNDPCISRDFLVQLWVADKKIKSSRHKRRRRVQHVHIGGTIYENQSSFQLPFGRWFSGASVTEERSSERAKPILKQPPLSEAPTGYLEPTSSEEVKVAPLLARSNLLITRSIEWANLMLGFEQENQYAVVDPCYPQTPAGFIREQSNIIARQVLRTRRPFLAYITDAMGNELFRVHRPFWWITSTIYAEINGKEIGVVHRRWHLWKRVKKQFAVVENPGFWNWTFTLKDINGDVLAEIDRNWRGFGFELFTDAGQYVIRFGHADSTPRTGPAEMIPDLEVVRPLTLSERAVALALAVSLDNDYFSRHGGWGIPFIAVEE